MLSRSAAALCLAFAVALCPLCITACTDGAPSVPTQSGSPWPKFRGNAAQTGATAMRGTAGGKFFAYPTGAGIFSSPIVGADGTIYVGSADRYFYALAPDGTLKWKVLTGEIIDSAALIDDKGVVYFGSGDGHLRALDGKTGTEIWKVAADQPEKGAFINWFEGNVAIGPAGNLYVPNDNLYVYSFGRKDGATLWKTRMPDQTWSLPAIDTRSGDLYWGNNNLVDFLGSNLFAVAADGTPIWDAFTVTPGTVAASPMLTLGNMIVGGFDGYVRAYAETTGAGQWEFGTRDHLYASPALLPDGSIVQASTDGSVYALDPLSGVLRWQWDGIAPIRSSPAVDGDGHVYFGAGDGRFYALNADGTLRYSMLLIPGDRHDLNSSPALGTKAIYIGGESGEIFSVPYDYCLAGDGAADARCKAPLDALPSDGPLLYAVGPFGATSAAPSIVNPNSPLVFGFRLRAGSRTVQAALDPGSVTVTTTPPSDLTVEVAGDGKFLTVHPTTRFAVAADGTTKFNLHAPYLVNLTRSGLALSGGTLGGAADLAFTAKLTDGDPMPFALQYPANTSAPAGVWEVSRLALPLPTLLPSYNQIGFDSLHYLVGLVEGDGEHGVAWMAGAMLASGANNTVIDPQTRVLFPLAVTYKDGFLTLENQDGLRVELMNAVIPFRSFRMSVPLSRAGDSTEPLRLVGSTICGGIAVYGLFLQRLGLCNPKSDVLTVMGGALFHPYLPAGSTAQPGLQGPPSGLGTVTFSSTAKALTVTLGGTTLRAADHSYGVLLVDVATGKPVTLSYGTDTVRTVAGDLIQTVVIPFGGHAMPANVRAWFMVDTYPAAMMTLAIPPPM